MQLEIHKKLVKLSGLLLFVWGGLLIWIFIKLLFFSSINTPLNGYLKEEIENGQPVFTIETIRIDLYISLIFSFLLCIPSLIAAFGILFYRNWGRVLSILVSIISLAYVFYMSTSRVITYFRIMQWEKANIGLTRIPYSIPPIFVYILVMLCFSGILIIMLTKNSKLIFRNKETIQG
jgi:glucan phosphoethanolaminetransferase (alkaline phosphatase superfamily)